MYSSFPSLRVECSCKPTIRSVVRNGKTNVVVFLLREEEREREEKVLVCRTYRCIYTWTYMHVLVRHGYTRNIKRDAALANEETSCKPQ